MANIKISQLTETTEINNNDEIPIVQNGMTKKIKLKRHITQQITTGVEFATNEYIDNNRIYRKRINFGELPNNSSKLVAHGLGNVTFVKIEAIANENNGQYYYPIPYVAMGDLGNILTNSIGIVVNNTDIRIVTARSVPASAYVDLYYIKNS